MRADSNRLDRTRFVVPAVLAAAMLASACSTAGSTLDARAGVPARAAAVPDEDAATPATDAGDDVAQGRTGAARGASREVREPLTRQLVRGLHPTLLDEGQSHVEIGYLYTDTDDRGSTEVPLVGIEYGVTDRFDVGARFGAHPAQQSVNALAGLDQFDIGVMAMYELPTPVDLSARLDVNFNDETIEYRPALVGRTPLARGREVYFGIGGAFNDESGDTERLTYSGAFATEFSRTVVGLVELDGAIGRNSFHEMYVTPGLRFRARKRIEVLAGTPIGLTGDSAEFQIFVGIGILLD